MRVLGKSLASTLGAALIAGQMGMAATAAPLPTNIAAMKSVVADGPTQVYWRGGWGWGWGAGAIAGALIGGAIANSAYGYYGGPGYYYGNPYSYYGYSAPYYGYYAPYGGGYYTPYYAYPRYGYYARPYRVYRPYYRRYSYW